MREQIEFHCLLSVGQDRIMTALELISEAAKFDISMHVVWRGGIPEFEENVKTYVSIVAGDCSLSKARNILLRNMMKDPTISDDAVIFLADDDGQFPVDFHDRLEEVFSKNLNWVLGSYGPSSKEIDRNRFPENSLSALSRKEILRISSSLGIYVRFSLLKEVGFFNEDLGLGSRICVGEDTEFALRLKRFSGSAQYNPRLLQIHPYKQKTQSQNLDTLCFLFYMTFQFPTFTYSAVRYAASALISRKIQTKEVINAMLKEFSFRFSRK